MAAASPRWQSISCGVSVPHRRRLSIFKVSRRPASDRRVSGFVIVFTWIAAAERGGNDTLDKLGLGMRVRFVRFGVGRRISPHQLLFQPLVVSCHVPMLAQIVAKGQRSSFFDASPLDEVDMMSMGPRGRAMKKRTKRIVRVRDVNVTQRVEWSAVRGQRLQRCDRDLNIDNRLGAQPRDSRGAVMIDADRQSPERSSKTVRLLIECFGPARIVGDDCELVF